MKKMWKSREEILLAAVIFFAPAHFFLKLKADWTLVNGLPVDYLYPKIFAVDLFLLMLLAVAKHTPWNGRERLVSIVWLGFCILHLALHANSPFVISSAWFFGELTLNILFLRYLLHKPNWWRQTGARIGIVAMVCFQLLVGWGQILCNHHIAGYWLLGEPTLSTTMPDVAKSDLPFFGEQILPYGTTAHPHVLALFLAGGAVFAGMNFLARKSWWKKEWQKNKGSAALRAALPLLPLSLLFRTESLTVGAALATFIALVFGFKKFYPVFIRLKHGLLFLPVLIAFAIPILIASQHSLNTSWSRRLALQEIAAKMFVKHPIAGIGANQFAAQTEGYGFVPASYRFRQPVHHAGLVWLSETGLLGLLAIILIFYIAQQMYALNTTLVLIAATPLALIFSLDHFLLSIRAGQLFSVLMLSILVKKRSHVKHSAFRK